MQMAPARHNSQTSPRPFFIGTVINGDFTGRIHAQDLCRRYPPLMNAPISEDRNSVMKTTNKIWLSVGVFVVAGTGAIGGPLGAEPPSIKGLRAPSALA